MNQMLVCWLVCCLVLSVKSFEYDYLSQKAVFPPDVLDVAGEPKGHQKPLGSQRLPEGPIKEYTEPLKAKDFWKLHVKPHIPLVYRGYLKESPAVKLWNDEYLTEHYGNLDVLVEHKSEDRSSTSGRMRLRDFLKNYKDQDMYIVSMFPTDMMHEVRAIPSILCGTFKEYTHESNLWISNGGTRSVVHYDADHNLHCMLDGRKDFIMINNNLTTKSNLYFQYKDPNVGSGYSFLDPDTIDMNKFKKIAKVPWTYATLYPGDCIFIPSMYIHQVRGYGRTIAVTTLFTADVAGRFNDKGCTDDLLNEYHTMADIKFQWTYKKGDQTIDMGYRSVSLVKNEFKDKLRNKKWTKTRSFTKNQFVAFAGAFSAYGRNKEKMLDIWTNVFKLGDDVMLDEGVMDSLSHEQWKVFCRAIEEPHGVVTNGTEPVFVRPGERHKWEQEHPDEDEDNFMTDEEKLLHQAAARDPMLMHLSGEEKEEYLRKKKEKRAKFGLGEDSDDDADADDGINWRINLGWRIDDIPNKYQGAILKGKIPEEFKDEFMENLPEVVLEKHADELSRNSVPEEVLKVLKEDRRLSGTNQNVYGNLVNEGEKDNDSDDEDSFGEDGNDEDRDGENGDGENGNDEDSENDDGEEFPVTMDDLDLARQRKLLSGKISKGDAKELIRNLPKYLKTTYAATLKEGIMPKEILMKIIGSDEENYENDKAEWTKKVKPQKQEL